MDATQAGTVYELVVNGFADLGISDPRSVSRSFLLRDLLYAGQLFRCEGWQAVWLFDRDAVEFYDAAGNLTKALTLVLEAAKKAA
jgi:hypothetical protein